MTDIEKAIKVATMAHANQLDKGGEPYLFHVWRVTMAMHTEVERIVALLHDVGEDAPKLWKTKRRGFTTEVVEAVEILTHRKCQSYEDYLGVLCKNPLAVKVKRVDLLDNMDMGRLTKIPTLDAARLRAKYLDAWHYICLRTGYDPVRDV